MMHLWNARQKISQGVIRAHIASKQQQQGAVKGVQPIPTDDYRNGTIMNK